MQVKGEGSQDCNEISRETAAFLLDRSSPAEKNLSSQDTGSDMARQG
jgi:hypothetical protein